MDREMIHKVLDISKKKDTQAAVSVQKQLLSRISLSDKYLSTERVAGVDISYDQNYCYCAIVVVNTTTLEIIEKSFSRQKIRFPYIPGLLFYREFPVFYDAFEKIKTVPDILIFDGQGLSHQRMMGIATMAGMLLDIPTIGCAKSHLYGNFHLPGAKKFDASDLTVNGMVIGYVLRTKDGLKPVFISTGYRVSPRSSLEIVKKLVTRYKLPLPTHYAHNECESWKKSFLKKPLRRRLA